MIHFLLKLSKVAILIYIHRAKYFINYYSQIVFGWIDIPCYLFISTFTLIFHYDCPCPPVWQWQIGIIGLFLAWIIFLRYINAIPFVGKYVLMLERIAVTFSKVALSIGIPLILAFAWPLYMALHDPSVSVSSNNNCNIRDITLT